MQLMIGSMKCFATSRSFSHHTVTMSGMHKPNYVLC